MKSRLSIIGMCLVLMLGAVYIFSTSLYQEHKLPSITKITSNNTGSIPIERGVFTRSEKALDYQGMPESKRSLATYYDNRAYPGAPPTIPHLLISEKGIGGKNCLQCHQNGGYVDQFKAFAPVTPHPEWANCKQCHVPQKTKQSFRGSNWEKIAAPSIHRVAMVGAPPMIPHALDLKNNCLSCHAGSAAPKEIRVSHPERVNCRQCHLPVNTEEIFIKPPSKAADFKRPSKELGLNTKSINEAEVKLISEWIDNKENR